MGNGPSTVGVSQSCFGCLVALVGLTVLIWDLTHISVIMHILDRTIK